MNALDCDKSNVVQHFCHFVHKFMQEHIIVVTIVRNVKSSTSVEDCLMGAETVF